MTGSLWELATWIDYFERKDAKCLMLSISDLLGC